jgi:HSP20 family protein
MRLFHSLFFPAAERLQEGFWRPAVDVYRTPSGWLVKVELAGVRPGDVRVSVCGSELIIGGSRRDWFAEEGHRQVLMEIAYSAFERRLELPINLEPADMTSELRDGMLLVRIHTESVS